MIKTSVRICTGCGTEKPLTDYYESYVSVCKLCVRERNLQRYQKNKRRYKKTMRKYNARTDQKQKRKEYMQTAIGVRVREISRLNHIRRYPGRYKARNMVKNAIRDGRLIRQPCEKCGDPKGQAHHDDYRKPMQVRWLCRTHHLEHHFGEK